MPPEDDDDEQPLEDGMTEDFGNWIHWINGDEEIPDKDEDDDD